MEHLHALSDTSVQIETYRKPMKVDDEFCMLEVVDTAGAEQFTAQSEIYIHLLRLILHLTLHLRYRRASAYVLVFSLTEERSMRDVEFLRHQIYRIRGVPVPDTSSDPESSTSALPIVIVGAKSDLISEREVDRARMESLSQEWGCPFYETSAKMNWNVTEVFEEIVRQIRARIPEEEKLRIKRRKGGKCLVQ
ncbi:Ras- protein rsr1 [Tulasnella sp. 417]|nr:Ras- protein rsr1 [Tulasnella sp. 417]